MRPSLETAELSLTVSKKDIEYLRDNALISYQVASFEAESIQGSVSPNRAKKLQNQMSCILENHQTVSVDTNSITPPLTEKLNLNESTARHNNEISVMFGNSQLDRIIGDRNIRLALVGSYTKRISQRIAFGFHIGITRSKLNETDYIEDYQYNSVSGDYVWVTSTTEYTYNTRRIFIGPKVSVIAYETEKLQFFASAGVSAGLYKDTREVLYDWEVEPIIEITEKVVFNYDLYAGAHYFLNKHFGVSATVGMGISRFRLGLCYQF